MQEKEVEIDWNGAKAKVKLRRLTFGQRNDCLRKATKVNPMTASASLDVYTFNEERLMHAIVEAPFTKTMDEIRNLTPEIGDLLITEIDKWEVSAETQKNSVSPSGPSA